MSQKALVIGYLASGCAGLAIMLGLMPAAWIVALGLIGAAIGFAGLMGHITHFRQRMLVATAGKWIE